MIASRQIASPLLVLDVGTGTGRLIQAMTRHAAATPGVSLANVEFIGLDIEPHMLARADAINATLAVETGCARITWLLGSALEMSALPIFHQQHSMQKRTVDLLTIGFGSISHFYLPGQPERFLAEVARVLTPGTGQAQISVVNKLLVDPERGLDKDITDPLPPSEHSSVEFPGVVYRETVTENGVQGNVWRVVRHIEVWKGHDTLLERNIDTAVFRPLANVAPSQDVVKEIWCQILDLEEEDVESDSNFFALGGDSIDALKVARLAQQAGIPLTVHLMIRHPRLSDLVRAAATQPLQPVQQEEPAHPASSHPSRFIHISSSQQNEVLSQAVQQCEVVESAVAHLVPCTPMQTGLMVLTAQQPGLYWAEQAFEIPPEWSVAQVEAAWARVVEANEILRSRIIQLPDGNCYMAVLHSQAVATKPEKTVRPSRGSPFGKPLIYYWVEPGRLRWHVHHAIYDAWSQRLILDAVVEAYRDPSSAQIVHPPFSAFASHLAQKDPRSSTKFWRQYLHGFEGQPFPRAVSLGESTVQAHVSGTSLWGHEQQHLGFTAATAIQTAWGLVLARYNETSDVVFGVVSNGRTAEEVSGADIASIIGPTIATFPVRLQVDESSTTVAACLASAQAQHGDCLPHEHVGLAHIASLGKSGPAQATRFQSLLVVQPDDEPNNSSSPIREVLGERRDDYMDYPLSLECFLASGAIRHSLTYTESCMSRWEAEQLLARFIHVLNWIVQPANQHSLLSELQLWTSSDATTMQQWHATPVPLVTECLHTRIEKNASAGQWNDSPAVVAWDAELTYHQLLAVSRHLARQLQAAGVGPEVLIPIAHEKSIWSVISIIAVLQAGGAFVLLDSGLPVARMHTMISVVNAPLVICSQQLKGKVTDLADRVLCLDPNRRADLLRQSTTHPLPLHLPSGATAENAAYAVFTSGTTGIPKAVVAEHRQVATAFEAQAQQGMFQRGRRMLQVATYSFDPSIADMLGPLLVGGVVCIPREDEVLTDLAAVIRRFQVDVIDITPSVANLLDPAEVPTLKELRLGGEAVTAAQLARWTSSHSSSPLAFHNSYGPSECCVTAALTPPLHVAANPLNFGIPVGCRMAIVKPNDPHQLVALGLVGELAIQGPIVTRGYLNNPDAQAKAFLESAPWEDSHSSSLSHHPRWASRVYLTGDLARFAPDGSVIFVGRKDHQVKLNGQRIELGEIEATARKHEGVEAAVAMVIKTNGCSELVLVAQCGSGPRNDLGLQLQDRPDLHSSLQQHLATLLPAYMVPAICLLVNLIPLSLTGKTERKGLQQWVEQQPNLSSWRTSTPTATIPASDTVARKLSQLLAPSLPTLASGWNSDHPPDVAPVAAGLDSIRMVSFVRAINHTFGVRLPLSRIPRAMVLTELAHEVRQLQRGPNSDEDAPESDAAQDQDELDLMLADLQSGIPRPPLTLASPSHPPQSPPPTKHHVFLTGSTGYVGTAILHQLLTDPRVQTVYLLVRSPDWATGLERVQAAAITAGWWDEVKHAPKVQIWPGDLSRPHLGLSDASWNQLAGTRSSQDASEDAAVPPPITSIIHNGALVHWHRSYAELRAANVHATAQLVACVASNPHITRLEYISGGAQWDPADPRVVFEPATLRHKLRETNGYGQSKLIAEQIVAWTAAQQPTTIPRFKLGILNPALIIGGPRSHRYAANLDDLLWRLVSACVLISEYYPEPEPQRAWIYVSTADAVADAAVSGLLGSSSSMDTRTTAAATGGLQTRKMILSGLRVGTFWDAVNAGLEEDGAQKTRPLRRSVTYAAWISRLSESIAAVGEAHPCWPVMHVIETMGTTLLSSPMPPTSAWGPGERWDEVEEDMARAVTLNVRYLKEIGYLGRAEAAGTEITGGFRRRG
ncbi:acetyl-CoA synthetase-like protein [Aspergillus eucalypticola CBS 122712]|uniref:Acetyl-CoA synthetase-like protein n=1 Tax=Aspergillus eucalypticola (strain CBS 122712 / IBT 29274) TaxID=1448314 RepID=A0A317VU60_ASPEC|nr:acetyl-CoA synthetase-like protein [Aspergillus eucalypticola CBS 122712]PWY77883.1 acetyl-CoA synthetase-like protein [Aspergillus eucalypticola CBS 122712]